MGIRQPFRHLAQTKRSVVIALEQPVKLRTPRVVREQHRDQRPVGPQVFRSIRFEIDASSSRVVGEPEYSPGYIRPIRSEDVAMLPQIRGREVLSELLLSSIGREAV